MQKYVQNAAAAATIIGLARLICCPSIGLSSDREHAAAAFHQTGSPERGGKLVRTHTVSDTPHFNRRLRDFIVNLRQQSGDTPCSAAVTRCRLDSVTVLLGRLFAVCLTADLCGSAADFLARRSEGSKSRLEFGRNKPWAQSNGTPSRKVHPAFLGASDDAADSFARQADRVPKYVLCLGHDKTPHDACGTFRDGHLGGRNRWRGP